MDLITVALLLLLVTLLLYAYRQAVIASRYWLERGVPCKDSTLFFGDSMPILLHRKNVDEQLLEYCQQFPNEPLIGRYELMQPQLIVRDPDLVERVLIKDFGHFVDRGFPFGDKDHPEDYNLFVIVGNAWRALRIKLTPLFSSGRLQGMYKAMAECGSKLVSLVDQEVGKDVDLHDILGRYAMDVIGYSAYGIDSGCLSDPDNEFRRMGRRTFKADNILYSKIVASLVAPRLAKYLGIAVADPIAWEYFSRVIKRTFDCRKERKLDRKDFVQLLLQLREEGRVDLVVKDSSRIADSLEISEELIIGQSFAFFSAAFEATATTILYALYELSKHPEIQEITRAEVMDKVKEIGSGELTYDSIKEMKYLEQVVKESMRKHAPIGTLLRECTKDYTFPNGLKIGKGQMVSIPVFAIHQDPNFYPEPEQFRPERFSPDNHIPSCAYLPFGNGPRMCLAKRFAMLEINNCLAKLLMSHRYELSPKTKEPLGYSTRSIITTPKNKIYFNIFKLKNDI